MTKEYLIIYLTTVAIGEIITILMLKWSEYNED